LVLVSESVSLVPLWVCSPQSVPSPQSCQSVAPEPASASDLPQPLDLWELPAVWVLASDQETVCWVLELVSALDQHPLLVVSDQPPVWALDQAVEADSCPWVWLETVPELALEPQTPPLVADKHPPAHSP
jgi:hypothetical protein